MGQANDCLKGVRASSTYKGICDVLLQTVVEYGKVLDTHAPSPPTKKNPNRAGGAKYRKFTEKVLNNGEKEEEVHELKLKLPSKLVQMQRSRLLRGLEKYKYLSKGCKYSLHHLLEEKVKLVTEANKLIAAAFLAAAEVIAHKRQANLAHAEKKAKKKAEKDAAKQKATADREKRKAEARAAAKAAKEKKQKDRAAKKEELKRKREEVAAQRRYD